MSKYIPYHCLLIITLLLLASCSREDQLVPVVTDITGYPTNVTSTSLTIRVQSNGRNLSGVTVANADLSQTTDEYGVVVLRQARRTELGFTIQLKKEGYVSRTILIPAAESARHLVKVLKMDQISQSELVVSEGTEIYATDAAEISAASASYSTSANADVSDISLFFFSGSFGSSGADAPLISKEGSATRVMHPIHSFSIEASADGEAVSLAAGAYLDADINIGNIGVATGDMQVLVQYLDPVSGLLLPADDLVLREESIVGRVTKLGTYYVGAVHEADYVETQLVNSAAMPVAYVQTSISADDFVLTLHADNDGRIATYLKTDAEIAVSNTFGDESYTTMDPVSSIELLEQGATLDVSTIELWGEYQDCEDATAFDGYILHGEDLVGTVSDQGQILATTISVNQIDGKELRVRSASKEGEVSFPLPSAFGRLDIGIITVCSGEGSGGLRRISDEVRFDEDEDGVAENTDLIPMLLRGYVLLYKDGEKVDSTLIFGSNEFEFSKLAVGRVYELEFTFDNAVEPEDYYMYADRPGQELAKVEGKTHARRWTMAVDDLNDLSNEYAIAPNGAGTVMGRVLSDIDGNGTADLPLANVEVSLYLDVTGMFSSAELISSTITDLNGDYEFANIPNRTYYLHLPLEGSTVIQEGDETPNTGEQADDQVDAIIEVFLQQSETDTDNNFLVQSHTGVFNPGSISGFVRQDTDGDALPDEDIEGAVVTVYQRSTSIGIAGSALQSITTAADGSYTLSNMPPGEYLVEVDAFPLASFGDVELILDKDESPEADEPVDDGPPDGLIIVNVDPLIDDADNNAVVRIN